jgi:hypothetical protein
MIDPTPGRWTCSFRARMGARANATFGSAEQAMRFAEEHAAVGEQAEWARADGGWVLRLFTAEYLVKPAQA